MDEAMYVKLLLPEILRVSAHEIKRLDRNVNFNMASSDIDIENDSSHSSSTLEQNADNDDSISDDGTLLDYVEK